MSSEESDDEPLSVLAASKKLNPKKFIYDIIAKSDTVDEPVKKRKKKSLSNQKLSVTIKINRKLKNSLSPPVIERPKDVWLYLKDLNPTGPYSCLLCSEWFINKPKIIVHYVLNHKKDFCGICRYFVPDRDAWWAHIKFHTPWPCSQCEENFPTELALRQHLSGSHQLVHCRLCHFRVPDNDQYHTHLYKKHNVTNVSTKDEDVLWELEYEGSTKFLCLLCSKSNNLVTTFYNHYMGYHHFTLKCFTSVISGRDPPFSVFGANVSAEFVDGQLKQHTKLGYIDVDQNHPDCDQESDHSMHSDTNALLNVLIPEIKQEAESEPEDVKCENDAAAKKRSSSDPNGLVNTYKGTEDFDVTLTELIILQKCYYDYIDNILNDVKSNVVPESSLIDYEGVKSDTLMDVVCGLCKTTFNTIQTFTSHMNKMHTVKSIPVFTCRICATTFDSHHDLEIHTSKELGEFEDLWICQFCDKEFDSREMSRRHLTEHWDMIEYDNCFSPHLGFKCKYCPTLFWNEIDRETHQVRVHFNNHKEEFYKCQSCNEIFGDKIWFIHHHLEKHLQQKIDNASMYLLKCCVCCVVMSNVDDMRNHFNRHHPEAKKVYCSLGTCQYRPLCHRKSFKFHLRTVHNPSARPERTVCCTVCGREFVSSRACGAHMTQVHGPGKYKCKLCKEVMHTLDERKLHYLIRHPGRHPFECTECGKSFQYKSSLYMHKQEHAPNKQTFTCNYCGKVFKKKDSFREHVQIHEGPRHACSYCPMRFVQRSNMLRHERRHTGERPYACQHCSRTFADKGACTSHARTHSRDTSYSCVYCGQTFVQKSKLTYHIRKHTGENLETCTVCSKLFTSACALREHMKIHDTNKENLNCPLCDRKYKDERSMIRHLRTTHTDTDFKCPICRKALTSAAGLRHHVITHSRIHTFVCKFCPKSYAVKKSILRHLRKRHAVKGTEINIIDYYTRLDPRETDLALDEETMTSIFGPPKKATNDILIGDFVTFTNKLNFAKDMKSNEVDDENDDEDDNDYEDEQSDDENDKLKESYDNRGTKKEIGGNKAVKSENEREVELEPTDFVSVKIEPLDDYADG